MTEVEALHRAPHDSGLAVVACREKVGLIQGRVVPRPVGIVRWEDGNVTRLPNLCQTDRYWL